MATTKMDEMFDMKHTLNLSFPIPPPKKKY